MNQMKKWISENIVVLFFCMLCIAAYTIAGQNPYVVASDLINRVMRNSIMVLALIIPILTGMGLNFGIVVGAMSAQAALIFVITGMIAGYFGQGIYLLIFLVLLGTVIPFWDDQLSISTGIGVKDTLNLQEGMKGALDAAYKLPLSTVCIIGFAIFTAYTGFRLWKSKDEEQKAGRVKQIARWACLGILLAALLVVPVTSAVIRRCSIPVITLIFILLVSLLCQFVMNTKLGQDFRSVGNDIHIAESAGINVNKIRIIATIFSTVLASWGQFAFLQNMGTFSTYTAQQNVGTFSIAALLVGGASIDRANVKQAFIGVVLFQLLFLLAPAAGTKIFNDSQVGEYFRTIISNGVIAVALVLHAMHKAQENAKAAAEAEA